MFKDAYKKAMDEIKPRDGLMEQVLKTAESAAENNVVPFPKRKNVFKYAASIAAALVICVTAAVYPQVEKTYKIYETEIEKHETLNSENPEDAVKNESEQMQEAEGTETKSDTSTESVQKKDEENMSSKTVVPKTDISKIEREKKVENSEVSAKLQESDEPKQDLTTQNEQKSEIIPNIEKDTKLNSEQQSETENVVPYAATENSDESANGFFGAKAVAYSDNNTFDCAQEIESEESVRVLCKTSKEVATQYDAVEIAKEFVSEYDDFCVYVDEINCVWRVDFIFKGEVENSVYVTYEGVAFVQNTDIM